MFTCKTSNRHFSLGVAAGLAISILLAVASLTQAVSGIQIVA